MLDAMVHRLWANSLVELEAFEGRRLLSGVSTVDGSAPQAIVASATAARQLTGTTWQMHGGATIKLTAVDDIDAPTEGIFKFRVDPEGTFEFVDDDGRVISGTWLESSPDKFTLTPDAQTVDAFLAGFIEHAFAGRLSQTQTSAYIVRMTAELRDDVFFFDLFSRMRVRTQDGQQVRNTFADFSLWVHGHEITQPDDGGGGGGGATGVAPSIGALLAAPAVRKGESLQLRAVNVQDADDDVAAVVFYRDVNHDGVIDQGDVLEAMDEDSSDGWAAQVSTLGLDAGVYKYLAMAIDGTGKASDTVADEAVVARVVHLVDKTGAFDSLAKKKRATYTDAAGQSVRVDLKDKVNASVGEVWFATENLAADAYRYWFDQTSGKSNIKVKNKTATAAGDVFVSGDTKKINAKRLTVRGNIDIAGVLGRGLKFYDIAGSQQHQLLLRGQSEIGVKLKLHDVRNLDIRSAVMLQTIKAQSFDSTNDSADMIESPIIGKLRIKVGLVFPAVFAQMPTFDDPFALVTDHWWIM